MEERTMSFLQRLSLANLAGCFVFLFASTMIQAGMGYPFWWSAKAVVCVAVTAWLVVFVGLSLLGRKGRKRNG